MTDTFDPLGAMKSFFFANAAANDKSLPQSTRQKIAMAMMMQKRAYPKTLGEGLGAIGDAIGDAGMLRSLQREAADTEARGKALDPQILGGAAAPAAAGKPLAYDTEGAANVSPPVVALTSPQQGQGTIVPAAPAVPLPPDQQQSYEPNAPVRLSSPDQLRDWRNQNPMRAPPAQPQVPAQPLPSAQPMPPLPPDQPPPNFNDRFGASFGQRSDAGPMPGVPVMAFGGEPSENVPPPAGPRDIVAATLASRQAAGGPQPNPMPAPMIPPGGSGTSADAFQQIAQAVPQAAIRPAPPDSRQQIQKAPAPQDEIGPDYVPPPRPETKPPPLTTPIIQNIQKAYRDAAPADREMIAERYKGVLADEQAKVSQAHEMWKAQVIDDRAYEAKRQELLSTKAQRGQTYRKTAQEMVGGDTGAGPSAATPPGAAVLAGPDPRLGTPQSPQRSGIPEVEPVPPGVIPAEWAKDQAKKISATKDAFEKGKPALQESLDLIDKIRAHEGKSRSIGLLGGIGAMTAPGRGFTALHEQLLGKNLVAAYQVIKGTGPVGEREGANVAKAQAALTTAATEKDYDTALNTLESILRGGVERTERKLGQPVTAYQKTPDDPYAPDKGQLSKSGNFEYVGGDPQDKRNWKRVK